MKTKIFLLLSLLCTCFSAGAQFTLSGRIEFERRTNLHQLWKGNEWLERMSDKVSPIMINYFNLDFNREMSRYSEGREGVVPKMGWGLPPGAKDEIVQNFQSGKLDAIREVLGEKFHISDSLPRLKWRIEKEVRSIAGYACRKAVTRICDSVYVVAFYAEAIPVSGGPEEMGGLPGMILELAVPRLYTTWIATKVEAEGKPTSLQGTAKGKALRRAELEQRILKGITDWGKDARRNVWWALL